MSHAIVTDDKTTQSELQLFYRGQIPRKMDDFILGYNTTTITELWKDVANLSWNHNPRMFAA